MPSYPNYIKLAGSVSPGLIDIYGAADGREFSIRQPPFTTGALIIYKRRELAKFTVEFRLYTDEHHTAWREWRKVVDQRPSPRTRALALDIQHPLLEELDIKSAVVQKVHIGRQIGDGEWMYAVDFLEHRGLPQQSLAKVEGSKAAPIDPFEQELLDEENRVKKVAQELAL